MPPKAVVFTLLVLTLHIAWPADLAREQRIRAHIEERISAADALSLKTGDTEFLAIHMAAQTEQAHGAVILLHDRGANPDWLAVIQPIRMGLPAHGWQTLSLQMPVAASDARMGAEDRLIADALPRITFAVESLVVQNIHNIGLLGHGLGARMATHWLARGHAEEVRAFVAVSLTADPHDRTNNTLADLEKITIPMLDIYGSRDIGSTVDSATHRKAAALKAGNQAYRQLRIEGADHQFNGHNELLLGRIRAWLSRTMAEMEK